MLSSRVKVLSRETFAVTRELLMAVSVNSGVVAPKGSKVEQPRKIEAFALNSPG